MTATRPHTMSRAEINRCKAALQSKLRDLIGDLHGRDELQIEQEADPLDQVRSSTDRELAIDRLDQSTRLVRQINLALSKMEEGAYGVCDRCEEPIAPERLAAVPWAGLCIQCQSKAEAAGAGERAGHVFEDAA